MKKARFFDPETKRKNIMSNGKKVLKTGESRVITTKKGTYLLWNDSVFGGQRRVNLSKLNNAQYFQSAFGLQRQ